MASYPPMKLLSFFLEIMPLAGFFVVFELYGLFAAAMISVMLGVMVMGVNWIKTGRLARFALFSIVMSAGLTFAALYFNATIFIKIQPTIFNGLFASVLLGGLLVRRAMMREFLAHNSSSHRQHGSCLAAVGGCFSYVLLLQMSLSGAMQVMLVGWRSKPSLRLPPACCS